MYKMDTISGSSKTKIPTTQQLRVLKRLDDVEIKRKPPIKAFNVVAMGETYEAKVRTVTRDDNMKFPYIAELISNHRAKGSNYSQEELSILLGYKNGQFMSNIERGLCSIPSKKINLLSKLLFINKKLIIDAMVKDTRIQLERACAISSDVAYGEVI